MSMSKRILTRWEETGLLKRVKQENKMAVAKKLNERMNRVYRAVKAGKITAKKAGRLCDQVIIGMRSELNPS